MPRNVEALQGVQPRDIPPSDITARLGAPWLPTDVIQDFVREVIGGEVEVFHTVEGGGMGRACLLLRRHRGRHVGMGHSAPARRPAPA